MSEIKQNTEIGNVDDKKKNDPNNIGIAGFIASIIAFILLWVPYLGWILCSGAMILSFIGLFKQPRTMAIVGLIVSLIALVYLLIVFAGVGASLGGVEY